ncbi:cathepsin propeptide inhibitor domain protein [Trichuris suis]|nr:cathepsin propeptide inhibitor domain protein [Trichuris suis]
MFNQLTKYAYGSTMVNSDLSCNRLQKDSCTEMADSIALAICYGIVVVVAVQNANEAKSPIVDITDSSELEHQLLLTFNSTKLLDLIGAKDEQRKNDWKVFMKAMLKFRRWYNTEDELMKRFKAFQKNMRLGEKLKENDLSSATYGVTEFFDMTSEEFMEMRGIGAAPSRPLPKPSRPVHHHNGKKKDATKKDKKKIKPFMNLSPDLKELECKLLSLFNSTDVTAKAKSHDEQQKHDWIKFVLFMHQYERWYCTKEELLRRFGIFQKNMRQAEHNQKNELGTAIYGVTKFSDLSSEEFTSSHGSMPAGFALPTPPPPPPSKADRWSPDLKELECKLLSSFKSNDVIAKAKSNDKQEKEDWIKFVSYMYEYNRWYCTKEELLNRFGIFQRNMRRAERNQKNELGTATYGITKFSDLSPEEFRSSHGARRCVWICSGAQMRGHSPSLILIFCAYLLCDHRMAEQIESFCRILNFTDAVEALLYNSLEAQSTSIVVHVHVSKFKFQVVDNGVGISADQARNIAVASSTNGIRTLSAVIRLAAEAIIEARQGDKALGYRMIINKEGMTERLATRHCQGTTVTIKGLFSMLPVRQKGTSVEQELRRLTKTMQLLYIGNPSVAFLLFDRQSERPLFEAEGTHCVDEAFQMVYGDIYHHKLEQIDNNCWLGVENHCTNELQVLYNNRKIIRDEDLLQKISKRVCKWRQEKGKPRGKAGFQCPVFILSFNHEPDKLKNVNCLMEDTFALFPLSATAVDDEAKWDNDSPLPCLGGKVSLSAERQNPTTSSSLTVSNSSDEYAKSSPLLCAQYLASIRKGSKENWQIADEYKMDCVAHTEGRRPISTFIADRETLRQYGVEWHESNGYALVQTLPLCFVERRASRDREEALHFLQQLVDQVGVGAFRAFYKESPPKKKVSEITVTPTPRTLVPVVRSAFNEWACKGAVKFGDQLNIQYCQHLIDQLASCQTPFCCAHGRRSFFQLYDFDQFENDDIRRLERNGATKVMFPEQSKSVEALDGGYNIAKGVLELMRAGRKSIQGPFDPATMLSWPNSQQMIPNGPIDQRYQPSCEKVCAVDDVAESISRLAYKLGQMHEMMVVFQYCLIVIAASLFFAILITLPLLVCLLGRHRSTKRNEDGQVGEVQLKDQSNASKVRRIVHTGVDFTLNT